MYPETLQLIGNTPLVKLRRVSEETGCTILGKAEFMNPGGSVKDRAALYIIRDAEKRGLIEPGGTIVEGTAGNTGIGIAVVANANGGVGGGGRNAPGAIPAGTRNGGGGGGGRGQNGQPRTQLK